MTDGIWLTCREAAQEFKLTPVELRGLALQGKVHLVLQSGVKRFSRQDILSYLRSSQDAELGLHRQIAPAPDGLNTQVEETEVTEVVELLGGGDDWRDYSDLLNGFALKRGDLDRWVREGRVRMQGGRMYFWPDVKRELADVAEKLQGGR